jgi:hypothetical protein
VFDSSQHQHVWSRRAFKWSSSWPWDVPFRQHVKEPRIDNIRAWVDHPFSARIHACVARDSKSRMGHGKLTRRSLKVTDAMKMWKHKYVPDLSDQLSLLFEDLFPTAAYSIPFQRTLVSSGLSVFLFYLCIQSSHLLNLCIHVTRVDFEEREWCLWWGHPPHQSIERVWGCGVSSSAFGGHF